MMIRLACFLLLASVALVTAAAAYAEQTSAGRNVSLEYLERGFDLEGTGSVSTGGTGFWATPEGRRRYAQNQLKGFYKKVDELTEINPEDWVSLYDASDRSTLEDLKSRSKDVEDIAGDILKFFDWSYGGESIEADALPDASFEERLARIAVLVRGVLPALSTMASSEVLDAEAFLKARRDLAEIRALCRSVRD